MLGLRLKMASCADLDPRVRCRSRACRRRCRWRPGVRSGRGVASRWRPSPTGRSPVPYVTAADELIGDCEPDRSYFQRDVRERVVVLERHPVVRRRRGRGVGGAEERRVVARRARPAAGTPSRSSAGKPEPERRRRRGLNAGAVRLERQPRRRSGPAPARTGVHRAAACQSRGRKRPVPEPSQSGAKNWRPCASGCCQSIS